MKYKTYPKMKDSGIEWIGDIPEEWNIHPLKFLLRQGKIGIKIGPFGSSLKLDMMVDNGFKVYGQENVINQNFELGHRFIDEEKFVEMKDYQILPKDIVVTMMGTTGLAMITPENIKKGIMDSHLVRIKPNPNKCEPNLLAFLINSADYVRTQFKLASKGAIMEGLNSSILKTIEIVLPPLIGEQDILFNFLKNKTSKINSEISKNQKLIELLKAKRQAIINHAATKGLDPTIPMKNSGIDWVGEIPEHWEIWSYNNISKRITYGFTNPMPSVDDGPWMLTAKDIKNGTINYDTARKTERKAYDFEISGKSKPKINTVLITKDGTLGETAIVDSELLCINQSVASIEPNEKILSRFLQFSLLTNYIQSCIKLYADVSTMGHISVSDLAKWKVCLPTLDEQKLILNHLEKQISRIEDSVYKITCHLKKLREYRQSIISSAVTGKICVTN